MSQLGRIGGQVLTDNLLRAGVDLAFETDLLYLDVNNLRIGVRNSTPVYALDINGAITSNDLTAVTQIAPGNLRINSANTITTTVGGIDVFVNGGEQVQHDRLVTANLIFNGNLVSSTANANIVFDPNGAGTVELRASTAVDGDVNVTGNVVISGNLVGLGTLTFGNQTIDTVTVNVDFTQSLLPGDDAVFALGADAGDSSKRHWADLHTPQWQNITTGAWPGSGLTPLSVTVSTQQTLDGMINKISAVQSNDDINLLPYTGITRVENTRWQSNDLTNLLNTPLAIAATAGGYYQFAGTNAYVIPAGANSQRRVSPEQGETRWNTEIQYLECYDGSVWQSSIGAGPVVTEQDVQDLGNFYTLMLG